MNVAVSGWESVTALAFTRGARKTGGFYVNL
jgi:hypothetical protein